MQHLQSPIEQINYLCIWMETNCRDLDCPSWLSSGISYFFNKYIREFVIPITNTFILAHLTPHQGNNLISRFLNRKFKCSSRQKNAFASLISYAARIMPTTANSHWFWSLKISWGFSLLQIVGSENHMNIKLKKINITELIIGQTLTRSNMI